MIKSNHKRQSLPDLAGLSLILSYCVLLAGCGQDSEKETWVIPCERAGYFTVYFRAKNKQQTGSRLYDNFNGRNVMFSDQDVNTGHGLRLTVLMKCGKDTVSIPYCQSGCDAVNAPFYATSLWTGRKGDLTFETILIAKNELFSGFRMKDSLVKHSRMFPARYNSLR